MAPKYEVTLARERDLPLIPVIELAAARLLTGHAPESVLCQTSSREELNEAQAQGHLWVALADGTPVGFAQAKLLEPAVAHLEEIDVLPEHGRRGLGRKLVIALVEWAANSGFRAVTLTTFRHLRWNMPFYLGLGFEEIQAEELSPALVAVLDNEARRGLDRARRVAMRRWCKN